MSSEVEKSAPETVLSSKEQIELLQKLISQQSTTPPDSSMSTGSIAQTGNFSATLSTQMEKNSPWIVDSAASDHTTSNANMFHKYSPKF